MGKIMIMWQRIATLWTCLKDSPTLSWFRVPRSVKSKSLSSRASKRYLNAVLKAKASRTPTLALRRDLRKRHAKRARKTNFRKVKVDGRNRKILIRTKTKNQTVSMSTARPMSIESKNLMSFSFREHNWTSSCETKHLKSCTCHCVISVVYA